MFISFIGMDFCVHNYIESTRLAKLTSLQEKFLKHAMNAFPKVKRIVYSTCSLFPEENERVITNVVKTSRAKWRVQDVKELLKGQWNNFGSGMYGSMGTRCLYSKPESDFTTGFFLAVLDRDQRDMEKSLNSEKEIQKEWRTINKPKAKNEESDDTGNESKSKNVVDDENEVAEDDNNISQEYIEEVVEEKPKSKKKKRKVDADETRMETDEALKKKKKKKNKRKNDEINLPVENIIEQLNDLVVDSTDELPKKKKKKDKHKEIQDNEYNTIAEDVNDVDHVPKKSKKKKRKCDPDEMESMETQIIDQSESCKEVVDIGDVPQSIPKKKKKKNKDS